MKKPRPPIRRIFVHPASRHHSLTASVLAAFPDVPVSYTEPLPESPHRSQPVDSLYLLPFKGEFLKPCPCTPEYLGCDYYVINTVSNCNLGCTYCILQSYLNTPRLHIYTNYRTVFDELDRFLAARPAECFRIGTGELTDSLILDDITGIATEYVHYFARRSNAVLELKTKTDNIAHLLGAPHGGRTVMAWTLSPPKVIRTYEGLSAGLSQRLRAAAACTARGYPVAFHFDPIIHYAGWETDYPDLVAELYRHVPPSDIAWISLGSLRFMSDLKEIVEGRLPACDLFQDEFIRGLDGKARYFIDLRLSMYRRIVDELQKHAPPPPLYFCMESADVWQEILGWVPADEKALRHYLTRRFRS
ncbi:MAG: DNA photolyase [Acidobacteria bacterium]|nr:DNA photolyase [Acidobacteriota bacterium]